MECIYATLYNNSTQNSVLLNSHNDMSIRLSNIKALDVIVKIQSIKKYSKNYITKILKEYLLHLFLCYNRKCNRFIPKLYCIYKYKKNIIFVMEKLNGITFQEFISIDTTKLKSNTEKINSNSISKYNSTNKSNNAIKSKSAIKSNSAKSNNAINPTMQ